MDDIETQVQALIDAIEADDVEAAKVQLLGIGVGVLKDVRRIANSLERLAGIALAD